MNERTGKDLQHAKTVSEMLKVMEKNYDLNIIPGPLAKSAIIIGFRQFIKMTSPKEKK